MNIWESERWKKEYQNYEVRSGLRLRFDKEVDEDVKNACKEFCKWLRKEYVFPVRVPVYIKNVMKIKTMYGDFAYGTCFKPYNMLDEPYIRIAVGDYQKLKEKWGKKDTLLVYLATVAHELTHYFQWVNQVELTEIGEERQATRYARMIVEEYMGANDNLFE